MIPRFRRAVCDLRPIGKSLGLKSGKAQNERMFSGLPPKRLSASSDLGVIAAAQPGCARRLVRVRCLARDKVHELALRLANEL